MRLPKKFNLTDLFSASARCVWLLCFALLLSSCGDENANLVGSDTRFLRPNQLLTLTTDTLTVLQNFRADSLELFANFQDLTRTTFFTPAVIFGRNTLPDGKTITATTRLKFFYPFADSLRQIRRVLSATLLLAQERDTLAAPASLPVELFRSSTIWRSSQTSFAPRAPINRREILTQITVQTGDTLAREIPLPTSFADTLIAASRRGDVFLKDSSQVTLSIMPTGGSGSARVSTIDTKLRVVYDIQTPSGTERRTVLMDVFDATYTTETNYSQVENTSVFLSPSTGDRALLNFNLSALRPSFQIVNVELVLRRDTLYSPIGATPDFVITSFAGTTANTISTELREVDMGIQERYIYRATVSRQVQRWIVQPSLNNGFVIRAFNESGGLKPIRFFGPTAPDSLRPRLIVTYITSN